MAEAYRDQAGCLRASLMRAVGKVYEGISTPREREQSLPRITDWLKRQKPTDLLIKAARRKESYGGTEAANLAALIKAGLGFIRREPVLATRTIEAGGIKPPTREQLMGRR